MTLLTYYRSVIICFALFREVLRDVLAKYGRREASDAATVEPETVIDNVSEQTDVQQPKAANKCVACHMILLCIDMLLSEVYSFQKNHHSAGQV